MNWDLPLNNFLRYLLQGTTAKVSKETTSSTRTKISKTQKSPSDYSILVVDNSYGYIYVKNIGGYIPVKTLVSGDENRYFTVKDGSPIVPDPNTLVIDDGYCYSMALYDVLVLSGYHVDAVPTGIEAIKRARAENLDLIIMGSQIKHNANDKPNQKEAKRVLDYVLKNRTDIGVIFTVLPPQIEPIDPNITQMLTTNHIPVLQKPYDIASNNDDSSYHRNQLMGVIRNMLGVKPK